MSFVKASNFDLSNITFSNVRKMGLAKMVFVNKHNEKIRLQLPKMSVPFGMSKFRPEGDIDGKGDSYKLSVSFYGENENPEIKQFKTKMEALDELIVENIQKNHKEWLNSKKDTITKDQIIEDKFSPNVKQSETKTKDGEKYPAIFEMKLDRQKNNEEFTGKFVSDKKSNQELLVFNENKEKLELNETNYEQVIPKGCHVVTLVELVYISITTKVSCKWKLVQAKVYNTQKTITEYAIEDDEPVLHSHEDKNEQIHELKDDLDDYEEDINQHDTEEVTEAVKEEVTEAVKEEVDEVEEEVENEVKEEVKEVINVVEKQKKGRGKKLN